MLLLMLYAWYVDGSEYIAHDAAATMQAQMSEPYTVNGTIEITLNVNQPTLCVVLHATDMNITHAALEEPHTHGGCLDLPPQLHLAAVDCLAVQPWR